MRSKPIVRIVFAICLCLAGACVSAVLLAGHYGETWAETTVNDVCSDDVEDSGCDKVEQSQWSSFAGIPVAAYGMVFYLSLFTLLILSLFASSGLRSALAGIAAIILALGILTDIYLLGLQAFLIHAYCKVCIFTYVLSTGAFFAIFPTRRAIQSIPASATNQEGRLALAGWILGTLAFTAFVWGSDAMLNAKSMYRDAMMLFDL
ncbi:MAG: vitamin K epoxide reductase family protein [Acidobacteriota bacterium]